MAVLVPLYPPYLYPKKATIIFSCSDNNVVSSRPYREPKSFYCAIEMPSGDIAPQLSMTQNSVEKADYWFITKKIWPGEGFRDRFVTKLMNVSDRHYGKVVNKSLRSVAFAASPNRGLTLKISSIVRKVELCV